MFDPVWCNAVASILDPSTPDYQYLPFFYSRIFDLGWQVRLLRTPHRITYNAPTLRGKSRMFVGVKYGTTVSNPGIGQRREQS